jgi:hypothetical protein
MIRIYIENDGIEGYNEGCSCCSSTVRAGLNDIKNLTLELENQIKQLKLLQFLIEKHGEDNLVAWKKQYDNILYLESRNQAALKYEKDNNTEGTFYKDCFDTRHDDSIELVSARKIFSKVPKKFKEYMGINE